MLLLLIVLEALSLLPNAEGGGAKTSAPQPFTSESVPEFLFWTHL